MIFPKVGVELDPLTPRFEMGSPEAYTIAAQMQSMAIDVDLLQKAGIKTMVNSETGVITIVLPTQRRPFENVKEADENVKTFEEFVFNKSG